MKKIKMIAGVLVAAMALLAGILMLTGCGMLNTIKKTYNKWYKYNKAEGIDVPLGLDTSEDATSLGELKNAEFYVRYSENSGLTVAIQSTKKENVELYNGLVSTSVDIVIGATKQYNETEFGSGKWAALITLGDFSECSTPKIVSDPESCFIISDALNNGIQWKKVLKKILINKLLGDD